MNHYDDIKVRCPFEREHILPMLRVQYHCVKCEQKYLNANPGKKVYHCKYNYMHIFLDEEKLKSHQSALVCKKDQFGQTLESFVPDLKQSKTASEKRRREAMYKERRHAAVSSLTGARAMSVDPPEQNIPQMISSSAASELCSDRLIGNKRAVRDVSPAPIGLTSRESVSPPNPKRVRYDINVPKSSAPAVSIRAEEEKENIIPNSVHQLFPTQESTVKHQTLPVAADPTTTRGDEISTILQSLPLNMQSTISRQPLPSTTSACP